MKPSILKLKKFFKLEADRGYDNKAVFGGLESMLESWEMEARADGIPEDIIQAVTSRLRDYHRLSEASRKEALHGIWGRVQRESGEIIPEAEKVVREDETPQEPQPPKPQPPVKPTAPEAEISPSPPPPSPEPRPVPPAEGSPAALNADLTVLEGIGPRNANTLSRLGLNTLNDMLYHFPRRYNDYTQLKPINHLKYGEEVTVIGTVQSVSSRTVRSGHTKLVEIVVSDGSAALRVTWFNQPWMAKRIQRGTQIVLSGKIEQYLGRLTLNNPEHELLERKHLHTKRIVPVYPLTAKIKQRWLRSQMHSVVTYWAPKIQDPLPASLIENADLMDLPSALMQIHFPDSWELLKAARYRLAFDEIFLLQLGVLQQKQAWVERVARVFQPPREWFDQQIRKLPFRLTAAQNKVINDLTQDLESGHPMNRLLQGDVGSGKTIVAAMGVAIVTHHNAQAALMAPTSILAEQHYNNLKNKLTGDNGVLKADEIRLMLGATSEAEKQSIREGLAAGRIKVLIGTHALIEETVNFADLQFVIIDEQHRFGVKQRAALRAKGTNPHLLVITATPIPRSLALTIYGDLDLSVIDEMPPGRQSVDTHVLYPRERERAYRLIRSQVEDNHQAFIIYPLVEESDKPEEKAAVEEHTRLQEKIFPNLKLGLLHGRLRPSEKESVMRRFRDGEYHILVSTSVVEVGVDVPNATVMVIEGANRFGLAQLHQFRGRVGRGQAKSYCLLIPDKPDAVENERLQAMAETDDGFVLAERDLEQRGPGDFLGTRQSGYAELRLASLTNVRLIERARCHAQNLFKEDPELSEPEHHLLSEALERFWSGVEGDIS
jgi:ATP-dependent DNA helicase RecG